MIKGKKSKMHLVLETTIDWFLASSKKKYFVQFADVDTRVEGWVKGELVLLFNRINKEHNLISDFELETRIVDMNGCRKKIDLSLTISKKKHLIELKAPCISRTKTNRPLSFYVRDIKKDFRKMDRLYLEHAHKWFIAFIYPNPRDAWSDVEKKLNEEFPYWRSLTDPDDFPSYLFVSVWQSR